MNFGLKKNKRRASIIRDKRAVGRRTVVTNQQSTGANIHTRAQDTTWKKSRLQQDVSGFFLPDL